MELQKLNYRPAEAALVSGIGRTRIYNALTTGELESFKYGSSRLIPADALVAWVNSLRTRRSR